MSLCKARVAKEFHDTFSLSAKRPGPHPPWALGSLKALSWDLRPQCSLGGGSPEADDVPGLRA